MLDQTSECCSQAGRAAHASFVGAIAAALLLAVSVSPAATQTATVTAAWDRNTDSATTGYLVYYGTASGNYQWTHDAGNQTTAQLTLTRGSVYYVTVRAYNASAQVGPPSNEATINLVDPGSPSPPTAQITATLQTATTALVTWSTTNATTATINGAAVALSGSMTVPISATTTYTLVATNAAGATATWTATVTVTSPAAPAPTAQITARLQTATTARITWSTTNATTATINGASVALSGSTTVPISATTTYTLVARNASGATATRSTTVTVTPAPAPPAPAPPAPAPPAPAPPAPAPPAPPPPPSTVPGTPSNLAATVNRTRATLTWAAPTIGAAPDRYLLDVGTSPGSANLLNGYPVGNVLTASGDLPKGRYYARVRAANAAGVSGYSNEVSFRMGRTLRTPSGFAVQWLDTTAVMSWSAPAADGSFEDQPTAYVLEAGTAPGMSNVATVSVGSVTSFQANVPTGTYYVRIRAVNEYGESEPTPELVLAPPGTPGAPTALTESGSGSTVELGWTAPSGAAATDYVIEAGTATGQSDIGAWRVGNVTRVSTTAPPGTYYVRVRALNSRGAGQPSNEVVVRR